MVRGLPFARGRRSYGRHHELWLLCRFDHRPTGGAQTFFAVRPSTGLSAAEERGICGSGTLRGQQGFGGHPRTTGGAGCSIVTEHASSTRLNATAVNPGPSLRRWVAFIRQIVESVYDKLLNTFGLCRERPHELAGLRARLAARAALQNFCMWLNEQSSVVPA
jgi:hypothetical protein